MDAESLKSLAWLLLWGGLFYVMMRYGCGAHMMGGHGHHEKRDPGSAPFKDPVCGMAVSPGKAAAAALHDGDIYYFCSKSCRDKFERSPESYLNAANEGEPHA